VNPGQGDDDPFAPVGRADVFDPVDFRLGDEVRVDLEGSDPGRVVGEADGFGLRNLPTLPYADRHTEYTRQALDALDHMTIPSDLQDIVRDYFTKLEP
ncbi:MAG: hypothetical protein RI637_12295, partial [Acidimicrobiia bacterium]|nr:hypothetical protein [Acidimicrobiia bacterium]